MDTSRTHSIACSNSYGRLWSPVDNSIAPARHFSTPPPASPSSREGKREGTTPTGLITSQGRREPHPGSAQRDRHRKTPLDEPGCP
jgi:hypothetical protein